MMRDTANRAAYAEGLLMRALQPETQTPPIRAWFAAEEALLRELAEGARRIVDFGCGTGRHLIMLQDTLRLGVGIDYEHAYLRDAVHHAASPALHFVTADATAVPLDTTFDLAICMTNTWGTMDDKTGVLREMRRLVPREGRRLISVYAPTSVPARREWYPRMGYEVAEILDEAIVLRDGFRSEHFSERSLNTLIGPCELRRLGEIGYAALF